MFISDVLPDSASSSNSANVLVFGIVSDTYEQGMAAISHIRQVGLAFHNIVLKSIFKRLHT